MNPSKWLLPASLIATSLFTLPLEAKTVTLTSVDDRTAITLNLGDTLIVELPSPLPGQYHWVSHLPNPASLTALNETFQPSTDTKKPGEGMQIFRYNAAIVGDTTLTLGFEIIPKGSPAPQTTSTFTVLVHIASGDPTIAIPGSKPAVLMGIYKGTFPCADCSGLDTELRLYAAGKFNFTDTIFIRTRTYRGAPHGDVVLSDRGEWTLLRGDAVDENASIYQLNPDSPEKSESYLVQKNGDALVQLDREQRPIQSKMNLTLQRTR